MIATDDVALCRETTDEPETGGFNLKPVVSATYPKPAVSVSETTATGPKVREVLKRHAIGGHKYVRYICRQERARTAPTPSPVHMAAGWVMPSPGDAPRLLHTE